MDYMGIIKRALDTTWRYKILWLFGLFAGAGGSGGNFNWDLGGNNASSPDVSNFRSYGDIWNQVTPYLPLLISLAVFIGLLAIVFFVLTFAAQGGLIHLVRESEEGRPVRAADGWRLGFSRWGRVFLIDLLVGLPVILVVVVLAAVFGASIVGVIAGSTGLSGGSQAAIGALGAGIGGLCFGILLLIVLIFAYSIVFGTVGEFALRYAILHDMTAIDSLKQGWRDFWGKRGAVVMYFAVWATRIVFGIVVGIVLVVLVAPAAVLAFGGMWPAVAGLAVLAIVLSMVPAAIFGTFVSAAWTIFFRRMTGAEQVVAAPAYASGYPPAPPVPPAPHAAPEPPAAPAAPEPPAAPAPAGEDTPPREG